MSIHNLYNKIKGIDFLYLGVLIGVGVCSFGLGRLSVNPTSSTNANDKIIIVEADSIEAKQIDTLPPINSTPESDSYIASKSGKLYYPANCSGAKRILEKNRVWFATADEAEKTGLSLAKSCH
jgi:hypothetical protein